MFDLRYPCTMECIYIFLAFNLMCLQERDETMVYGGLFWGRVLRVFHFKF